MNNLTPHDIADPVDYRKSRILAYPNIQEHTVHKFIVEMLHGVTGLAPDLISRAVPTAGLTSSLVFLDYRIGLNNKDFLIATALHEFTWILDRAGVTNIDKIIWYTNYRPLSALIALIGSGRY